MAPSPKTRAGAAHSYGEAQRAREAREARLPMALRRRAEEEKFNESVPFHALDDGAEEGAADPPRVEDWCTVLDPVFDQITRRLSSLPGMARSRNIPVPCYWLLGHSKIEFPYAG